ncbi:MAG: hypothetical protein LBP87_12445 [Planctomycetaceae bacterium]|jgi:hypothetical protein|nr:hypothetical protein [Planctomycetaceae bacterium]
MQTSKYLWKPPEKECDFIRVQINKISLKNFWHWALWKELLTQQRQECLMLRSDSKCILECTVYGTRECLINIQGINVKGVPTFDNTEARLYACEFINEDGHILAYTKPIEYSESNIDCNIRSIKLFNLYVNNEQQYIICENTYITTKGILKGVVSPYPWITITDSSEQTIMGASYCYDSGLVDDLVYVPYYQMEMGLLLGILMYYVCESEFYRRPA